LRYTEDSTGRRLPTAGAGDFASRIARDGDGGLDAGALAEHFSWPQWKAESALAYAAAYADEIASDVAQAEALEDPAALKALLPGLEVT
jgi:hypothetical protein